MFPKYADMTLRTIESRLKDAGIEAYYFEACCLAEHFLNIPRAHLIAEKDKTLPSSAELEAALERRCKRWPLQYIIGEWYFMDEVYKVTPDVLIPRQDTEVLVKAGADLLPAGGCFADLCTGSGCVAISLLTHRPDVSGVAVEKYSKTLDVAMENAELNGVSERLGFILGDVTQDVFGKDELFDAILSNPPYVSLDEYVSLGEEEKAEPRHALTDGNDGLSLIRSILDLYPSHINEGGFLALEIGCGQGAAVAFEARQRHMKCETLTDIEGRDRVCIIRK